MELNEQNIICAIVLTKTGFEIIKNPFGDNTIIVGLLEQIKLEYSLRGLEQQNRPKSDIITPN
jgi:hypothetical protein